MDGCASPRRLATVVLIALASTGVGHAAVPTTTTTTLAACQGLRAECHCTDQVACTALFDCSQPTVSCAEVRAICLEHCADHGGSGDCGELRCIDTCSGQPCR